MRSHRAQSGTTLIEIMIAMLLLSVGLLGLVGLHARSLQTTVDAENRGNSALLINELVTAMWLSHSNTNNTAVQNAFNNWKGLLPPGAAYSISAPDSLGAVVVTVTWTAPGQQSASQTVTNQTFTTVAIP